MTKRIITAVVGLILFVPVCIYSDRWVYPAVFSLLSFVAVYEMLKCVGTLREWLFSVPALLLGLAAPFSVRFFRTKEAFINVLAAAFFMYLLYMLAVTVFTKGRCKTEEACVTFGTVLYVTVSFSCLVLLRDVQHGQYLYLLAFIGPWVSDIFAFFCGRAFGKHKLIPAISPHKTVEGSVGAILLTPAFVVLYAVLISRFVDTALTPNYVGLILVGIVLSVAGQVGDLIASAIKRQYGIKDYGSFFPGHGGVLDRFDSILTVAPLLLLIRVYSLMF